MNCLDVNLWHQALAQIQNELPSQAYETWFQPTRAISSTETSLVVEVPSPFFRDWLTSHYSELITRTLQTLARASVKVDYAIASAEEVLALAVATPTASSPVSRVSSVVWPPPREASAPTSSSLNSRYTFDQFVIGPSNHFAHAAALATAESPAKVYNPLFLQGGVGLGKTHLMQAIGHRIREKFPQAKCLYLSSEQFTNQLISAIQNRSMASFRERFRSVDALLVDDIQFIGGKEATQEAFFHTFNTLYDAHKQIVISGDHSPKELRGVEERLVSRFEWGLVTDVQPPDLETRVAIVRKKAEAQGCSVPDPVTLFIAERVTSNIRELEGALNRVIAYSVLASRAISLSMAQEVLKGIVAENARTVTIEKIQRVVAEHFNVSLSDLKGKRRSREISLPRQITMALCRELTDASLPAIGEAFGGRDHATVLYACRKMVKEESQGGQLKELFGVLRQMFK
jgi:chromosomal replication initiator protein